ncbi:MAG TPA: formylglycine-generating enzyme family protein [Kofleriaceae bacterium]|nr:formylglycine-generating enzyme family protein [Kofleriaceae bacterium]
MAVIARARHPLKDGRAPSWAVAWGEDKYGAFAVFAVGPPGKQVEQRVRWIPPGAFLMGSPETERGRFLNEGPRHEVILTYGYWLGETPVTQALWVAVMGKNPSNFSPKRPGDLERPVEQVSWDDCQAFLDRLNEEVAGLGARLPTEAEWERACRAGIQGATWIGELSGETQVPELDEIAWYYSNSDAETHPVGRKTPNPYGLHDMLGNVYEWCADATDESGALPSYTSERAVDPVSLGQSSSRVIRGGAWLRLARYVRAAYRYASPRGDRSVSLGFRLAGGQESASSQPGGEPRSGDPGYDMVLETSRASSPDATAPR